MSDTPKDVCWIALDREVAEVLRDAAKFAGQDAVEKALLTSDKDLATAAERWAAIVKACRKSLVTECFEVGGEVRHEYGDGVMTPVENYLYIEHSQAPADHPTGPQTLIVIAGERDG